MLREAGKRDVVSLKRFLKNLTDAMYRNILRYAIELFAAPKSKTECVNYPGRESGAFSLRATNDRRNSAEDHYYLFCDRMG